MAANTFKIVIDDSDDQFYIEDPDGGEGEWAGPSDIATVEWHGRIYFAVQCAEFPGMKPGVVYALGVPQVTEEMEYAEGLEEAEEQEEGDEDDEEDGD